MKKLIFLTFLLSLSFITNAQKYCYIDTDYLFSQIPDYESAQKKLDNLSTMWQDELQRQWESIEDMKSNFEADKILLPEDMKSSRLEQINRSIEAAREFQNKKFGVDGDLFKKRVELIQPIQEKLYNAVKEYAEEGRYAFIFDISDQSTLLFANPTYDKSDQILKLMGYKKIKK
jgi:outer membrane protein